MRKIKGLFLVAIVAIVFASCANEAKVDKNTERIDSLVMAFNESQKISINSNNWKSYSDSIYSYAFSLVAASRMEGKTSLDSIRNVLQKYVKTYCDKKVNNSQKDWEARFESRNKMFGQELKLVADSINKVKRFTPNNSDTIKIIKNDSVKAKQDTVKHSKKFKIFKPSNRVFDKNVFKTRGHLTPPK
jgi:hypothetical protein